MASRFLKGLALALALAGCAGAQDAAVAQAQAKPAPAGQPQRLPTERLVVDTARGPVRLTVEVAADEATRERGLMYRRTMRNDEGMIFDFVTPQPVTFWMENTFLPLDMLFVGADGRIVNIARQAKPHDRSLIPSSGPIRAVIEINGGLADRLGIKPGDRVRDDRVFGNG